MNGGKCFVPFEFNVICLARNIYRSDIMADKVKKRRFILTPGDAMKYEIANELGLGEKLSKVGWGGLTAEETGRIGGLITSKKKGQLPKSDSTDRQHC